MYLNSHFSCFILAAACSSFIAFPAKIERSIISYVKQLIVVAKNPNSHHQGVNCSFYYDDENHSFLPTDPISRASSPQNIKSNRYGFTEFA